MKLNNAIFCIGNLSELCIERIYFPYSSHFISHSLQPPTPLAVLPCRADPAAATSIAPVVTIPCARQDLPPAPQRPHLVPSGLCNSSHTPSTPRIENP